jgi:hypothetical protein
MVMSIMTRRHVRIYHPQTMVQYRCNLSGLSTTSHTYIHTPAFLVFRSSFRQSEIVETVNRYLASRIYKYDSTSRTLATEIEQSLFPYLTLSNLLLRSTVP